MAAACLNTASNPSGPILRSACSASALFASLRLPNCATHLSASERRVESVCFIFVPPIEPLLLLLNNTGLVVSTRQRHLKERDIPIKKPKTEGSSPTPFGMVLATSLPPLDAFPLSAEAIGFLRPRRSEEM